MDEIFFSYKDYWNFSSFCTKKDITQLQIKNDIIALCGVSPGFFWKKFDVFFLKSWKYLKFCSLVKKYFFLDCPVPYLTKKCVFFGLFFLIKEGVFIPQKDTETVLEVIFFVVTKYFNKKKEKY